MRVATIFLFAALAFPAMPAWSAPYERGLDTAGYLGIGYWGSQDISLRYWLGSRLGLDAGFGFRAVKGANSYSAFVGAPFAFARFTSMLFQIRPVAEMSNQQGAFGTLAFRLHLLAEWFVPGTEAHLSVSGGPGIGYVVVKGVDGESKTGFSSSGDGLFAGALHLYF